MGERFEIVGRLKSDMEASSDNIRTRVLKDKQQLEILMSERPVFKEVTAGTDEKQSSDWRFWNTGRRKHLYF